MQSKKKLKIGFDLDGVIVGKPFFVPKSLLEWLYRAHDGNGKKYRVPTFLPEIYLRKTSHHWLIRPAMKKNLRKVKEIISNKAVDPYFVSGRFNFLDHRTQVWFKRNLKDFPFNKVFINTKNEQPHLFKEKKIKELKLEEFFDDDPIAVNYLKKNLKNTKIHLVNNENFNFTDLLSSSY